MAAIASQNFVDSGGGGVSAAAETSASRGVGVTATAQRGPLTVAVVHRDDQRHLHEPDAPHHHQLLQSPQKKVS